MTATVVEKMPSRLEQAPLSRNIQQEVGVAACAACPFMAMGCPGKPESAAPCPPEAKTIQKNEVRAALMDDSVGSITADVGGGYTALPSKWASIQPKLIPTPKQPVAYKPKVTATKSPERMPSKKRPGFFSALGELAIILLGGKTTSPVKK